jgi:A/G-specific adenine glycosylase
MRLTDKKIILFRLKIFRWWRTHRRDLPWRHTNDPYAIAVSEVMLQQTQVSRVIPKYAEFMKTWPDVYSLAGARQDSVLRIWKGMGYNRRALYLHRMAKDVVGLYDGKFPDKEELLAALPGLGTYTVRAILVFAFRKNTVCVDTNIRKIITHYFFKDKPQKPAIIQSLAEQLVPVGKSWEWHQALMDYGALELNQSRITYQVSRKKQKPFRETNRFFRGRIIDILREGKAEEHSLIDKFSETYGKDKKFTKNIIESLIKDQLAVRSKTTISLPR